MCSKKNVCYFQPYPDCALNYIFPCYISFNHEMRLCNRNHKAWEVFIISFLVRNVNSSETRHPVPQKLIFSRSNTFNIEKDLSKFRQIFIKTKKWHLWEGYEKHEGHEGCKSDALRSPLFFCAKSSNEFDYSKRWFLSPHHSTGIHRITNYHLQPPFPKNGNHEEPPTMSVATSDYLSVLKHLSKFI